MSYFGHSFQTGRKNVRLQSTSPGKYFFYPQPSLINISKSLFPLLSVHWNSSWMW